MHRVYLVPHDAPSVGEPTKGVRDVLSAACRKGNEPEGMTSDSRHVTVLVTALVVTHELKC